MGEWQQQILLALDAAEAELARQMVPPRLDILLARRDAQSVIPELGMGAWALQPTLAQMAFDPDADAFEPALAGGAVERLIVHEVNHCLRFASCPEERTLGTALVREGLAGHFVRFVLGAAPEPWETALTRADAENHLPDRAMLDQTGYDHGEWFFGTGDVPRWWGYTMGYQLVGRWLDRAGPVAVLDRYAIASQKVLDLALAGD